MLLLCDFFSGRIFKASSISPPIANYERSRLRACVHASSFRACSNMTMAKAELMKLGWYNRYLSICCSITIDVEFGVELSVSKNLCTLKCITSSQIAKTRRKKWSSLLEELVAYMPMRFYLLHAPNFKALHSFWNWEIKLEVVVRGHHVMYVSI